MRSIGALVWVLPNTSRNQPEACQHCRPTARPALHRCRPACRQPHLLGVGRYGGGRVPVARRLDRRATARTGLGCAPGGGHAGSEPTRTQLSAASPSEPRGRPSAGASGPGSGVARGVAARLRPCRHEGWDPALRFGAGFGGYSSDAGNKPQPSVGPSPRPACAEVPGNRSTPFCLLYGSVPRRAPVTRKANVPATRWASFACLRHSVSSQQDPGLQPDDHQKKPAGRTHAQREAAGHR
jgi:hypothetical protein